MNKKLIKKLQDLELDHKCILTRGMSNLDISKPIELTNILFRKSKRQIGYTHSEDLPFEMIHTLESFECYAYKKTHTLLGILCFELLFSEQSYIEFKIPNKQSEFKQLFIYLNRESKKAFHSLLEIENKETYKSFEYYPQEVKKFALSQFPHDSRSVCKEELPTVFLGCSDKQFTYTEQFKQKSDQLIISTTVIGLIQLAELFLDIGILKNPLTEICLENPIYGFGGLSEQSIEGRFWLPNSFGFYTEKLEDLKFCADH